MNYPKISIITVCFNMEKYIEQTIQSVLSQEYPNLEYIIVDGKSKDNTMNIVNKYKNKISKVISEPDNGMYHAIDKGIKASSGDIIAWINADDCYFPWTLQTVAFFFENNNNINWISGMSAFLDENRNLTSIYTHAGAKSSKAIANGWHRDGVYGYLQQESMFWRRDLYFQSGGLNVKYKFAGDFELWTKFALKSDLVSVSIPLGAFMKRSTGLSIGSRQKYLYEIEQICECKKKYPSILWRVSKNQMFIYLLRFLTLKKTRLIYYSYTKREFLIKSIRRSVCLNSLSELRYEFLFKK